MFTLLPTELKFFSGLTVTVTMFWLVPLGSCTDFLPILADHMSMSLTLLPLTETVAIPPRGPVRYHSAALAPVWKVMLDQGVSLTQIFPPSALLFEASLHGNSVTAWLWLAPEKATVTTKDATSANVLLIHPIVRRDK
jgi:hypothetical protein